MEIKIQIKRKLVHMVLTLTVILLLKGLFAWSNHFCDFYFHSWYRWSSWTLRQVTGIVPFSVGDVIYSACIISVFFYLLKLCYKIINLRWQRIGLQLLQGLHFLLKAYVVFLVFWGFNYERNMLAVDTGLALAPYNTRQLYQLSDTLLQLVNQNKAAMGDTTGAIKIGMAVPQMIRQAQTAYVNASKIWPALHYKNASIKPAIFGEWLNYAGVTGYLNPFTNEAQINTTTPGVLQPFITCHEMAHQIGYAPEEAANFVGYLAATSIPDSRFRYAANFNMFIYSVKQLEQRDSALAASIWNRAVPGVKADYTFIIDFYRQYTGKVEAYTTLLYDRYLKANKQSKGIRSYSEVTGWLMAYYKIK